MKKEEPPKCSLVRVKTRVRWGSNFVEAGALGIYLAHTRTDVGQREYEAIILDHYEIYFPSLGEKIHVSRNEFEIIRRPND